jgi:hypothetical protein
MNPDPIPNHPQGKSRIGCCIVSLLLVGITAVLLIGSWLYFEGEKEEEDSEVIETEDIAPPKPDPISPTTYDLTVRNGSGSGQYHEGARFRISAEKPDPDKIFLNWTTDNGGAFRESANRETSFIMPGNAVIVTANYGSVDEAFSGRYSSERERSKYEIDPEKKRFAFYTLIEGRFLLQTEIAPYQVRRVDGPGTAIEISGADNQAGGGPTTTVRVTKISESNFKLERIKPIGGNLGLFHTQN